MQRLWEMFCLMKGARLHASSYTRAARADEYRAENPQFLIAGNTANRKLRKQDEILTTAP